MRIISKKIIPLFLTMVMLASCNGSAPVLKTQPTQVVETALAFVGTAIAETQTAIPTATFTATLLPLATPLPPTETPIPTSALSFSGMPTVIPINNGITWSECVVPNKDYSRNDMEFLATCIEIPTSSENDKKMAGERVENQDSQDGSISSDFRITIGSDYFETKHGNSKERWTYELIKNGEVILKINPGFMASDPNVNFWNIGRKLVWELSGSAPVIVVDGVNFNEKYQLEGSFFPYEIKGKLIYIAKKNGKFHIVYDEKIIGAEFDSISMAYCCGMISVYYGNGQYWFVGRRGGTKFVVSIQ